MFKTGDYVVYESLGVCQVTDIRSEEFPPLGERDYYVLEMVYGPSTRVYAPVDNNKLNIRKVLSASQVVELIRSMPEEPELEEMADDERHSRCREIISSGDRADLVRLIKTLYRRRRTVPKGRKFPEADERMLKEAERILYEEFALVLDITPQEVLPFINGELSPRERKSKLPQS